MSELERRLREYGRHAIDTVEPVRFGDLGSGSSDDGVHRTASSSGRRRGRSLLAVAATLVAFIAGLSIASSRQSDRATVRDVGPSSVPDDQSYVTLPAPLPLPDRSEDTPIGSIQWTRVFGDDSTLPGQVTGIVGDQLVGADDADPETRWESSNGGLTWSPSTVDGQHIEAGGAEWVSRPSDGPPQLALVSADGEQPMSWDAFDDVRANGWKTTIGAKPNGLPVDLDGSAFVLVINSVDVDFAPIVEEYGAVTLTGERGSVTRGLESGESSQGAVHLTMNERDGRLVDLVADDGNVVATIDANVPGFEDVDAADLVLTGGELSRWARFDGLNQFVETVAPWPTSSYVTPAQVGDAVLVYVTDSVFFDSTTPALWRTTDGQHWEQIEQPGDATADESLSSSLFDVHAGAVIAQSGIPSRDSFFTEDGLSFTAIPSAVANDQLSRSDAGWVSLQQTSNLNLWASANGTDWETVSINGLYDSGPVGQPPAADITIIDSTIYISLTSQESDSVKRTLLIGHITADN